MLVTKLLAVELVTNSTAIRNIADRIGYVTMTVSVFNIFGGLAFIIQFLIRDRRRDMFIVLYLLLICTDLLTSSSGVSIGYRLSQFQETVVETEDEEEQSPLFAELISAMVFDISVRLSTIVVCVLSVVRCLATIYPLYTIKVNYVSIFLVVWVTATVLASFIPPPADSYVCPALPFPCTHIWFGGRNWDVVATVLVPFILPLVTTTAAMVAVLWYRIRQCGQYRQPTCSTVAWLTSATVLCTSVFAGVSLTNTSSVDEMKTAIQTLSLFLRCFLHTVVFILHNSSRPLLHNTRSTLIRTLGALRGPDIQLHVISNPAVQHTARSARWDRRAQSISPLRTISETIFPESTDEMKEDMIELQL